MDVKYVSSYAFQLFRRSGHDMKQSLKSPISSLTTGCTEILFESGERMIGLSAFISTLGIKLQKNFKSCTEQFWQTHFAAFLLLLRHFSVEDRH